MSLWGILTADNTAQGDIICWIEKSILITKSVFFAAS